MVKIELLHIVKQYKPTYDIYVIEEAAKLKNIVLKTTLSLLIKSNINDMDQSKKLCCKGKNKVLICRHERIIL